MPHVAPSALLANIGRLMDLWQLSSVTRKTCHQILTIILKGAAVISVPV